MARKQFLQNVHTREKYSLAKIAEAQLKDGEIAVFQNTEEPSLAIKVGDTYAQFKDSKAVTDEITSAKTELSKTISKNTTDIGNLNAKFNDYATTGALATAKTELTKDYDGKYFLDVEFIPRNESGGGYSDKINAGVMSGDLPDIITVDGPNISAYVSNNIIQPLDGVSDEDKSAYLDSIIQQGTIDNKLYALGAMESSVGLFYNKDIIEKAGIEIPSMNNPWTWDEFYEVCEKVKNFIPEKDYPIDMTFPSGESTIYYYAPFIWSNGGDFVSEDGLTVDGYFNSEKTYETVNYFKKLLDNKMFSKTKIDNLFELGRSAFKFDGAWLPNNIKNSYPDFNLGIAPYPVGNNWNKGRYTPLFPERSARRIKERDPAVYFG